jgi:hypothetical protein
MRKSHNGGEKRKHAKKTRRGWMSINREKKRRRTGKEEEIGKVRSIEGTGQRVKSCPWRLTHGPFSAIDV